MAEIVLHDGVGTNLTSKLLGKLKPGKILTQELRAVNNTDYTLLDIVAEFWTGLQNNSHLNTSGLPINTSRIIRSNYTGTKQVVHVDEVDADAELTLRTTRDKVFLYDGSSVYTDYTSGNVYCVADTNDYLYIGQEVINRNINFAVSGGTAGSYGALTFEFSDDEDDGTSFTACTGVVDGTSGFTVDGNVYVGDLTQSTWKRATVNGYCLYWIRVKAASVTTQAIFDVLHPNHIYVSSYSCIYDRFTCYTKSSDPTPVYAAANPTFTYENRGWVSYASDPTAGGTLDIVADFYYKIPQPGTYLLTFPSTTSCSVNGASAVTINPDGITKSLNVIPGIEIIFNTSLTTSDTATIVVSDTLKYMYYADDSGGSPGTWQAYDYTVGDIDVDDYETFHIKLEMDLSLSSLTALNTRYMEAYFSGTRN